MIRLANRTRELNFFDEMLSGKTQKQILLIEAPSGYGKSKLIEKFIALCQPPKAVIAIDLKAARGEGILYVFRRTEKILGEEKFPNYSKQIKQFLESKVEIEGNRLSGNNNSIEVVLEITPEERRIRLHQLQKAFFSDLQSLNQQIIFILDTFNEATEELAHWLEGQFLMEIAANKKFIALIAGQHIPKPNIEWSYCCESQKLAPIHDHQAWYNYATEEQLPFDLKEIGALVDCLEGIPAVVIKALQAGQLRRQ